MQDSFATGWNYGGNEGPYPTRNNRHKLTPTLYPPGRHANSLSYCTPRRISRGTINFLRVGRLCSISCALIVLVPRLESDLNSRMDRCGGYLSKWISLFFFFFFFLSKIVEGTFERCRGKIIAILIVRRKNWIRNPSVKRKSNEDNF